MWRGPVLFGVSVVAALAVALSTATVGAAPQTTPVSGPPPPCALVGGCGPFSTMTISPRSGPVGTVVHMHAVCAHVTDPASIVGSLIAASDGYVAAPFDLMPTPAAGPSGTFAFTADFTIPDTLYSSDRAGEMTPRPTAPGLHSVWARCFGTPYGEPWDTLPLANFCVTPSPLCANYARIFGAFENWAFAPGLFISHVATLFTPPVFGGLPPPSSTTTTRPRGGGFPGGGGTPGGGPAPDTVAPVVNSLSATDASQLNKNKPCGTQTSTVSWSASDNVGVASVTISWSGVAAGSQTFSGGSGSYQIGPFVNSGVESVTAAARDAAGNTGGASTKFTVNPCP